MALNIINSFEEHDRGLYAAPLGVVDSVIKESDCLKEYEETDNKLRTILESL